MFGDLLSSWEDFLQIEGWKSNFRSVDRLLRHYKRKVGSEHTKANACQTVKALSEFADKMPDELVNLSSREGTKSHCFKQVTISNNEPEKGIKCDRELVGKI